VLKSIKSVGLNTLKYMKYVLRLMEPVLDLIVKYFRYL
jgi:hypothetical protein